MKTSKLLYLAAELLERGWCRRADATDLNGLDVMASSDSACRWSISGAFAKAAFQGDHLLGTSYRNMVNAFMAVADRIHPIAYNDSPGRTQAEVVAKVREAAAIAAKEESK